MYAKFCKKNKAKIETKIVVNKNNRNFAKK